MSGSKYELENESRLSKQLHQPNFMECAIVLWDSYTDNYFGGVTQQFEGFRLDFNTMYSSVQIASLLSPTLLTVPTCPLLSTTGQLTSSSFTVLLSSSTQILLSVSLNSSAAAIWIAKHYAKEGNVYSSIDCARWTSHDHAQTMDHTTALLQTRYKPKKQIPTFRHFSYFSLSI